jgi:hypothetical protein
VLPHDKKFLVAVNLTDDESQEETGCVLNEQSDDDIDNGMIWMRLYHGREVKSLILRFLLMAKALLSRVNLRRRTGLTLLSTVFRVYIARISPRQLNVNARVLNTVRADTQ